MEKQNDIIVTIQCITYNHKNYIRQCLDGFVMQKTNFLFEAIIHDDASTDGTTAIVREYAEKYPDIIKPIYETENQYSKHDGSLQRIMNSHCHGKYIACCEGDDYWIDPYKLQKQVDYMESHPECTMTCSRAKRYLATQERYVGEQYCRKSDGILNPVDVVRRSGYYIATCSIVYRPYIKDNYPDYCHNCNVGDWPLQIMASMKGVIFYFDECMCVYRFMSNGSWSSSQKFGTIDPERLHVVCSQSKMFEGFSKDYPKYKQVFDDMNSYFVVSNIPKWNAKKKDKLYYIEKFSPIIDNLPLKFKPYYLISKVRIPTVKGLYKKLFLRKYRNRYMYYDSFFKRAFMKCLRQIRKFSSYLGH